MSNFVVLMPLAIMEVEVQVQVSAIVLQFCCYQIIYICAPVAAVPRIQVEIERHNIGDVSYVDRATKLVER